VLSLEDLSRRGKIGRCRPRRRFGRREPARRRRRSSRRPVAGSTGGGATGGLRAPCRIRRRGTGNPHAAIFSRSRFTSAASFRFCASAGLVPERQRRAAGAGLDPGEPAGRFRSAIPGSPAASAPRPGDRRRPGTRRSPARPHLVVDLAQLGGEARRGGRDRTGGGSGIGRRGERVRRFGIAADGRPGARLHRHGGEDEQDGDADDDAEDQAGFFDFCASGPAGGRCGW
jgi:hypothetical protein